MKSVSRLLSIVLLITAFSLAKDARGDEAELSSEFLKAYNTNIGMKQIIERHRDIVPAKIKTLLEESHSKDITPEEKAQKQYMAETMAREYKNVTGDISYLINVKKDIFNSKLHAPVNSVSRKGIHTVDMPRATANEKNVFRPDNIIINAGEWVRWENSAGEAHIFSSMPLIGRHILFTPSIEPNETWIQRFNEPGEYYYFCYIHNSMVGKITVLPGEKKNPGEEKATTDEKR